MPRYGIYGLSYGPCMCGRLTGAFRPPRACPKLYGRKYRIAAFHAPIADRSVGRAVNTFLQGARRMNPRVLVQFHLGTYQPCLGPPFEPLQSSSLKELSLKTALLLTLASVKRVGDLQALSVNPVCLEFGPNDSNVVLKPGHIAGLCT